MNIDNVEYLRDDTIVAIASELGGAIAILKCSGPKALDYLRLCTTKEIVPGKIIYFEFIDPFTKTIIDQVTGVYFQNPHSHTGEDTIELFFHGSRIIAEELISCFIKLGASRAINGEFSFRALKNGKINFSQARGLLDLFQSKTSAGIRNAVEKLRGKQAQWLNELNSEMDRVVILSELSIDFADQDVPEVSLSKLKSDVNKTVQLLQLYLDSYNRGKVAQEGFTIALFGPPNAGKSSLFNTLIGEERSIVTAIPGTTRDVVHEHIHYKSEKLGNLTFRILDTAGIRETQDPVEKIGVLKSQETLLSADMSVILIPKDGSVPEVKDFYKNISKNIDPKRSIVALSKSDLLQENVSLETVDIVFECAVSSVNQSGLKQLMELIANKLEDRFGFNLPKATPDISSPEEKRAIELAIECLLEALDAEAHDLFASEVRRARVHLNKLFGSLDTDELLGRIFSQFCIGK